jgi:hypothetical protein
MNFDYVYVLKRPDGSFDLFESFKAAEKSVPWRSKGNKVEIRPTHWKFGKNTIYEIYPKRIWKNTEKPVVVKK